MNIFQGGKGARPSDSLLYGSANSVIPERQDERQHGYTKDATSSALPNQENPDHQQRRIKERVPTDERHQTIEEWIG